MPAGAIRTLTTTRADGDFAVTAGSGPARDALRRAVVDLPWVEVTQVHGAGVIVADGGVPTGDAVEADALVTDRSGVVLAVRTADCAPVFLSSSGDGPFGIAHAGWRGIEEGVIEATVQALRALGAGAIEARVGPCIEGTCYEFGDADLNRFVHRYGSVVRCMTRSGMPGLSLAAAVTAACEQAGVPVVGPPPPCTACEAERYWSHRARAESGRMLSAIWRET